MLSRNDPHQGERQYLYSLSIDHRKSIRRNETVHSSSAVKIQLFTDWTHIGAVLLV